MEKIYKTIVSAAIMALATTTTVSAAPGATRSETTKDGHRLEAKAPVMKEVPEWYEFPDPDDLITEAPAGKKTQYVRDAYYWVVGFGWSMFDYKGGVAAEMVEGDDGFVYIKNPYTDFVSDSYLKGKREGDKITVELPQAIYREPDYDNPGEYNTYYACIMQEEAPGSDYYNLIDTDILTYTIDGDKITMDLDYIPQQDPWGGWEYPYYILGLVTDEGIWMSEGEAAQTWTSFAGELNEVPDGVTFEPWAMTYEAGGQFVDVAVDGSDVYLRNLMPQLATSVVKGSIEGGKVVIPSGQYLGLYNADTYAFFKGVVFDADGNASSVAELSFDYDAAARTIKGSADTGIALSRIPDGLSVIKQWRDVKFAVQPADIDQTPLTPSFIEWEAYNEETGQGFFRFNLPILDKDGYLLNADNMYYNVYFDDALETFYTDEYTRLEEDMTDVPYNFGDGWNFYALGTVHVLYYYSRGVKKASIVLCNKVDGTVYSSPDATLDLETGEVTTAVGEVEGVAVVTAEEWYTLDGCRVADPESGIYLHRTVMSDGSVNVEKKVVR